MADYFEVVLDPEDGLWLALKAGASFNFEEHGASAMVTVTYTDTGGHAVSQDVTVTNAFKIVRVRDDGNGSPHFCTQSAMIGPAGVRF